MDESRGDWWLVRRDEWLRGAWALSCDPNAGWDWRCKVGSGKSFAVSRLRATRDRAHLERFRTLKLQQLRAIVDKMHP